MSTRSGATRACLLAPLSIALIAALAPLAASAAGRVHAPAQSEYDPADGVIIVYADDDTDPRGNAQRAQAALSAAAAAEFGRAQTPAWRHARTLGTGAELVQPDGRIARADAERLMRRLAQQPGVAYVEANIRLRPSYTPNDTYFNLQTNLGTGENTYAVQAWDSGYRGQGKIIGIIDTGITNHVDLNANVLAGYDFISDLFIANDGNGRDASAADPGDWVGANQCFPGSLARNSSWHGTHVAGIAAAVTNNATGVAGMAFNAKILPVRALGRCGGTLADIADAVTWASGGTVSGVPGVGVNRANVINMSLGGPGACGSTMQIAINGAVGRGVPIVVAAGNDNAEAAGYTPAGCANVIVIGTHSHTGSFYGNKEPFSNYSYSDVVDLSAPGYQIASTFNTGTTVPAAATYAYLSGTSMSAPHVAGVIAMMMSKPSADCTPAACESIIKNNLDFFMGPIQYPIGWGRLNAKKALDATP